MELVMWSTDAGRNITGIILQPLSCSLPWLWTYYFDLQATTSIQEQTLTFVPKILAIMLVLALLGGGCFLPWGITRFNYSK